jgi:hypothetical protein
MFLAKKREQLNKLFQHPYRIVIFNDLNLHVIRQVRFDARTLLMTLISAVILIIIAVTVLIAFTPLREYIPGYTSSDIRKTLINNVIVVDSLEHEIQMRDKYYHDFKLMVMGKSPVDTIVKKVPPTDPNEIKTSKYNADSIFKDEIGTEPLSVSFLKSSAQASNISEMNFVLPLMGVITNRQNPGAGHFGIDIVSKANSSIASVAEGTITLAEWNPETGFVIQVQHSNNLLTVYKHNAKLLKKQGDKVKGGEIIAIMGNTGKETTGPHLHFEMWLNGVSLNPEEYIKF